MSTAPNFTDPNLKAEAEAEARVAREAFAAKSPDLHRRAAKVGGDKTFQAHLGALAAASHRDEVEVVRLFVEKGRWPDDKPPGWQAWSIKALATAPPMSDSRWQRIASIITTAR